MAAVLRTAPRLHICRPAHTQRAAQHAPAAHTHTFGPSSHPHRRATPQDPLAEALEDGTIVNVTFMVTSTQMLQGIFRSAYSMLTASQHTPLSLVASLDD